MKQIIINYLFVVGLPIIVGLAVRILLQRFNKSYFATVAFAVLALVGWIVVNVAPSNGSELYGILATQATIAFVSSLLTGLVLKIEIKDKFTIFTRRELLVTFDMKRQGNVCDILSANSIKYIVRVINRQNAAVLGSSRARTGSFGMNTNLFYEYKIYVHKKDYDNAMRLIR